jgi:hypothetical protein
MGAVELRPRKDAPAARGYDVMVDCFNRGLYLRQSGDAFAMSPPLIVEKNQIDDRLTIVASTTPTMWFVRSQAGFTVGGTARCRSSRRVTREDRLHLLCRSMAEFDVCFRRKVNSIDAVARYHRSPHQRIRLSGTKRAHGSASPVPWTFRIHRRTFPRTMAPA